MEQKYKDIRLTCDNCGHGFTWTANDQEFYEKQGWTTKPKKCRPCRADRKLLKQNNVASC